MSTSPPESLLKYDPIPGAGLNGTAVAVAVIALGVWVGNFSDEIWFRTLALLVVVLVTWIAKLLVLLFQTHREPLQWVLIGVIAGAVGWSGYRYLTAGPYLWARDVSSGALGLGIVVLLLPPVVVLTWLEASRANREISLASWEATPLALLLALLFLGM